MIHKIRLTGYTASLPSGSNKLYLGTRDSYGNEQLQLNLDPEWKDLTVTATFYAPGIGKGTRVLADVDGFIIVPPEATAAASTIYPGRIVFAGTSDGVQRISLTLLYDVADHTNIEGEESSSTPSVLAQAIVQIGTARDEAVSAASDANLSALHAAASAEAAERVKLDVEIAAENASKNVAESLQAAKASGAFNGPQGPIGPQGPPGPQGEPGMSGPEIDDIFTALITPGNVDEMFHRWFMVADDGTASLTELLNRWFSLLPDEATYGVRFYKFDVSQTSDGNLLDKSTELGAATPGTNTVQAMDPYCNRGAFWTCEVAYEIKNKDVEIKAISGIRGISRELLLSGRYGMVGVAQKTGWVLDTQDENFYYHRYRTGPLYGLTDSDSFRPLPEAVRTDGTLRPFVVHAKYMAGRDANGRLTSATGLAAVNFISMSSQMVEWRNRGSDYCGINGCDLAFRIRMFWLKYAKKSNSGILEGCSSYNLQKKAAISESGVTRVILSTADASGYLVGSTVSVGNAGSGTSIDRGINSIRAAADKVQILSIEDVTIDEVQYKSIILNTSVPFDTQAGITYISTMPWHSGSCDNVQGVDGSPTNCTNGKEPFIIQRLECQTGGYVIVTDQLTEQILTDDKYTHNLFFFRRASEITNTISSSAMLSPIKLVMSTTQETAWLYQKDVKIDEDGTMYPVTVGASSNTGMQAAILVLSAGSRICSWWAWGNLSCGRNCGLSGGNAVNTSDTSGWSGLAGVCGSGANRGSWHKTTV